MYDEAKSIIEKLNEDAKQKMKQSLNLEASRLQSENARKEAEKKRASNKKYEQCIKFLINVLMNYQTNFKKWKVMECDNFNMQIQ